MAPGHLQDRHLAGYVLAIYAGFDEHSRFVEVVLLTIWGHDYTRPGSSELKWGNFDGLLAPPTPRGAFVLGVRGGFEGFLLRRELAPATFLGCTVLSEPAVRFLAAKRHEDVNPVWGSQAMIDAYFKAMPPTEQQLVGQLLGTIQAEPKSSRRLPPNRRWRASSKNSGSTVRTDRNRGCGIDEGKDEDEGNVVIGPLQPSEES